MVGNNWNLVEEAIFTSQLQAIGNIQGLDDALNGLYWAIHKNPLDFDVVPGCHIVRVAKTLPYRRKGLAIPPLMIVFKVDQQTRTVYLLWIEVYTPEE